MFQILSLYISLLSCFRITTLDLYVSKSGSDSATGKFNAPFKTISKAINMAVPGTTIYIKSGRYNEKIVITSSGNEYNWITIRPYNKNRVTIDATGIKKTESKFEGDAVIYLTNCKYIRIQGLEICNGKFKDGSGIRLYGSVSNIELLNNKIHDIRGVSAMGITLYGASGKKYSGISNIIIQGNEIYDCEPAPSEAIVANGDVKNFQIINNHIHDVNNIGIDIIGGESWLSTKSPSNGLIANNLIERCFSSYEDGYAAGIYSDGASNLIIENNVIKDCDMGIEIGAENIGVITKNITIRGNIVYNNYKAGLAIGGYNKKKTGYVAECLIENNIFYKNNRPNDQGPYPQSKGASNGEIWVQYSKNNTIQNNIIHAKSGVNVFRLCWDKGYEENNIFKKNIYFTEDGAEKGVFMIDGKRYNSFVAYKNSDNEETPHFSDPKLTEKILDKKAKKLFKKR